MYLIALAWIYVVLMMAMAEALSPQGSVLGALITFVLYGVAPLSLVMYLLGWPGRRRARRDAALRDSSAASPVTASTEPDGGRHPPGDTIAPE